jgi:multiple antibiotic resistance protein
MVPIFVALTHGMTRAARRATAWKAVGLATVILVVFGAVGRPLLHYLGVTLAAFQIAGGILLLLLATDMVLGRGYTNHGNDAQASRRDDVSVFPLAVPLIAGPGALTSVILLHDLHAADPTGQAVIAAVMIGVLALVWIGFVLAEPIMKVVGVTGIHVVSRVLGIVLAAIAVNNVVEGLRASFLALGAK